MIQISSPTTPKKPEPKSILVVGPHGGGKTTLALQFPKPLVFDVDCKLDGPEKFLRTKLPALEYGYVRAAFDDAGKPLDGMKVFDNLVTQIRSIGPDSPWQTLIVDNLTQLSELLVKKLSGQAAQMDIQKWGLYRSHMISILVDALRATGKTCITLSHEELKETANPKNPMEKLLVQRLPTVQGSTQQMLGSYFTDVWRCSSELIGGNVKYKVEFNKTVLDDLKNSFGINDTIQFGRGDLVWPLLQDKLKGLL